ncbi:hypothetical protein O1L60_15170 [Streptomyces diastatochromogenes]|nr:hypothetical protein [Streptomyces diastatochromogenes]
MTAPKPVGTRGPCPPRPGRLRDRPAEAGGHAEARAREHAREHPAPVPAPAGDAPRVIAPGK